ncbi:TPA: sigma-70 family RNA polymerase sigma factor [Clostridioides difficile]|uniref:sigma-70 family RNA polymerase sigma factor n=1 Tax=Clostridioides difficile TaxID=1496 RepID=UPI0003B2892D|nr:sigma-70 family RNA polymerase sigma factor [Clostridioides difficile]MBY1152839.1 sigma-70 family RNA polymerase sigma factor [Clostridioides difficile]MBY1283036.1 sigma-70 family RNA polymerase sigma factor [Clostridioides difficile]MCE0686644.1 sigma-70 family RNA polymerase sigma factor [Clostridioides difficile]MCE0711385.1 sigma-70 family RNA polymerase sigma factor [Clostridioides difficile]MCI4241344.1 sigma-70 family RNA polymerase sigma factor [Clostridioides difficile]
MDKNKMLKTLVRKAQSGDELAFNDILNVLDKEIKINASIYAKYLEGIFEKDDLIAEAQAGLWKSIMNYKIEIEYVSAYFQKVIKNNMLRLVNKSKTKKFTNEILVLNKNVDSNEYTELIEFIQDEGLLVDEVIIEKERAEEIEAEKKLQMKIVKRKIRYIPQPQKEIIRMYLKGYDTEKISKKINKSYNAIYSSKYRAVQNLKEMCLPEISKYNITI